MPPKGRTLTEGSNWFWRLVDVKPTSECWPCISGSVGHQGHHLISVGKIKLGAHVIAWCIANGYTERPDGWILHKCDFPPCCNPDHLYKGDVRDNVRDMVERGRHANQRLTHCKRGHPLSGENVYTPPSRPRRRVCRTCQSEGNRRSYAKKDKQELKARRQSYPCSICGEVKNYSGMSRHKKRVHGSPGASQCAGLAEKASIPVRRFEAAS